MPVPQHLEFFVDPSRCIGCQACVQACTECDTHKGKAMIHLEYVDRARSIQTVPVVCMHCEQPTCAEVCPADAIKRTGDGVVQSARKPRCIACGNCVVACPFGVPELYIDRAIMMKCEEGRFHVQPHLETIILDEALEPVDAPDGEDAIGILGVMDPFAASYPGFLITGDNVHRSSRPCPCGLAGDTFLKVGRAAGAEVKGCGGIMATVNA